MLQFWSFFLDFIRFSIFSPFGRKQALACKNSERFLRCFKFCKISFKTPVVGVELLRLCQESDSDEYDEGAALWRLKDKRFQKM